MQVSIRFSGGERSDFGSMDFEKNLVASLGRFSRQIKQIILFIEDVNGPKGGIDKQCRCVLQLRRIPPIVIQDADQNIQSLISRVANRAAYAVSQKIAKKRNRRRSRSSESHSLSSDNDSQLTSR